MSDSDIEAVDVPEITLEQALRGESPQPVQQAETVTDPAPADQEAVQTPTVATDAPTASDERHVPLTALTAEREKRQNAERRLAELEARERANAQQTSAPDPLENPEGFAAHLNESSARATQSLRVEFQQELMRARHDDYDEKESKFLEMAQDNPALLTQAAASGNVAKFAYETVAKAEKFAEMQDVEGFEAKLRQRLEAELRAKLEAEYAGKATKAAQLEAATSLPSLATVGSGGVTEEAEPGLDALFGGADPTKRRRR